MNYQFSQRMLHLKESFIREILKVTDKPNIISFAGGLPNPNYFPVEELAQAAAQVMATDGASVLQYSTTEGYQPLRSWIAQRYQTRLGLEVSPDEILITNGSQQGLDLVGKIFLNPEDTVLLESPSYLGAIQAFSFYQPHYCTAPLAEDGVELEPFRQALEHNQPKLFYTVSSFQNPSGVSYSIDKRQAVAKLLQQTDTILVEDDPYGELRFAGTPAPPLKSYLGEQAVLLGSFSKIVSPGVRLGWVCASPPVMEKLIVAKQASDLHSNYLSQRIVYQYLQDNDLESHLGTIRQAYQKQCNLMVSMLDESPLPNISYTKPDGGMFVWLTLPDTMSATALFEEAIQADVAFVPGQPFYVDNGGDNNLRLNFSNADENRIEVGMLRLFEAMQRV